MRALTNTIAVALSTLTILASSPVVAKAAHNSNELKRAIHSGDHRRLAQLLKRRVNPNQPLPDGSQPLSWAIEQQDPHAVRLLLKHSAKVNDPAPTANLFKPLIVACLHPSSEVLNQLLDKEPNLNVRGPDDISALSLCAAHAPVQVLQRMINSGASVNAVDDNGQTPLMWAAANARIENFELLMSKGANIEQVSHGGFTPLMFAVKSGSAEMASRALAAGGDPQRRAPDGTSLIQLAMYQGNYSFALQLIDRNIDLDAYDRNGRQLLHAAVVANQPTLVQRLLDVGANIDALTTPSKVPWRYESNFRAGDYEFPLLPPIMLAAEEGHEEIMRLLASRGAKIDVRSAAGNNLVLAAAGSNRAEALEVALALSPDANVSDNRGETPLHRVLGSASGLKLNIMLKILAKHGARTDIANARGKTAADIAGDEHFKQKADFAALFR